MGRHMTVIQHDDLVGVADGTDPLSDNDLGGAGEILPEGPADFGIGGGVHGAGAVVQDENLRLLQDGTGDAEPLFLAAGDVDAALAQVSFQSLGHPADELIGAGRLTGRPDLFVAGRFIPPQKVFPDCAGEQGVLLEHHGDGVAQVFQAVVPHIPTAHQHPAGGDVVQAGDQLHQGGLGRTGAPQNAHCRAGGDGEVDIGEDQIVLFSIIAEVHMVEDHRAVGHLCLWVAGVVVDIGDLFQHFQDTAGGCHRPGKHHEDHGDHHQGHQNLGHIGDEAGQFAHLQRAGVHHSAAKPQDGDDGGEHDHLHHRHVENHKPESLFRSLAQVAVGGLKLFALKILPDKGLYRTDADQVLLHSGVHVVNPALENAKAFAHVAYDEIKRPQQYRDGHQEHHGQLGVDHHRQKEGADQHHRGANQNPHAHGDTHLHGVDVIGQAGDQRGGAEPFNVAERILLDFIVLGFPQLGAEALPSDGGAAGQTHAKPHGYYSHCGHQQTHADGVGRVVVLHAHIHNVCHHQRNQHLKHCLHNAAQAAHTHPFFILG